MLQDDDYFMHILSSDTARDYCIKKYPWSKGIEPCEIHGMYGNFLSPDICGKCISDFNTHNLVCWECCFGRSNNVQKDVFRLHLFIPHWNVWAIAKIAIDACKKES